MMSPQRLAAVFALAACAYTHAQEPKQLELPDPLRAANGDRIDTGAAWQSNQREYILGLFQDHMYGRAPKAPESIEAVLIDETLDDLGGTAIRRQWRVELGNDVFFDLLVYLPKRAEQSVPIFLGLNFKGNDTLGHERAGRWPLQQILERGYGLATVHCADFDPDFDDQRQNGVHILGEKELTWGTISAWAWGLSRALDVLQSDPAIDGDRVAVIGHSRLGKTALWAAARDERFWLAISNNSGCGGAAISRRGKGETIKKINTAFPHWFCDRFSAYNDNENELPVDQHELVALMAPRPVYIASASQDHWADPMGEFLAAKNAEEVYALFGLEGLNAQSMPENNRRIGEFIGYHIRNGQHDITSADWAHFLDFADAHRARDTRWRTLFKAGSFAGWHALEGGTWTWRDEVLVGKSPISESRHGLLVTNERFDDFDATLQFKTVTGCSGFYFRVEEDGTATGVSGFQAEIDPSPDTGGLYETRGRAWVIKPDPAFIRSIYTRGEWTTMTVSAVGKQVQVRLNGWPSARLMNDPGREFGHIALQLHGHQDLHVEFRDLRVRQRTAPKTNVRFMQHQTP